jgi:hypothetical protein
MPTSFSRLILATTIVGAFASSARAHKVPPYRLDAKALVSPDGAELELAIQRTVVGQELPLSLQHVKIEVHPAGGEDSFHLGFKDVALDNGKIHILLAGVARHDLLDTTVEFMFVPKQGDREEGSVGGSPRHQHGKSRLTMQAVALMRPDVVLSDVSAPVEVRRAQAFNIEAIMTEANQDLGARCDVVLLEGDVELDRAEGVDVDAGSKTSTAFTLALEEEGDHALKVRIEGCSPREYDETNNELDFVVTVLDPLEPMRYYLSYGHYKMDYAWESSWKWGCYSGASQGDIEGTFEYLGFGAITSAALSFPIDELSFDVGYEDGMIDVVSLRNVTPTWKTSWGKCSYASYSTYDHDQGRAVYISTYSCPSYQGTWAGYYHFASDYVYFSKGYSKYWGRTYKWDYNGSAVVGEFINAKEKVTVDIVLRDDGRNFGGHAEAALAAEKDLRYDWDYKYAWGASKGHYYMTDRVSGWSTGMTTPKSSDVCSSEESCFQK